MYCRGIRSSLGRGAVRSLLHVVLSVSFLRGAIVLGRHEATRDLSAEEASPGLPSPTEIPIKAPLLSLEQMIDAVAIMRDTYYDFSNGIWPDANDWTAAVMGTQVSSTLAALSSLRFYETCNTGGDAVGENLINSHFSTITSFYFGEHARSLSTQANDDMLWVVLGWLEAAQFANAHSDAHFATAGASVHAGGVRPGLTVGSNPGWYGQNFIPTFTGRSRIFWGLASKGWDDHLCGGGMNWNSKLVPYKNAITNELWISASASMYLWFPGDSDNRKHDKKYLDAAIKGYMWLGIINMTNAAGLYVDGYHIHGWKGGKHPSNGTGNCDERNEMVYTYNQGVILSGQRALWQATGQRKYLEDAHRLVRAVIRATGWSLSSIEPSFAAAEDTIPSNEGYSRDRFPRWAGLGRAGILEDLCDHSGNCGQDGHAFKGIYFHHFSRLCEPLPVGPPDPHGIFHHADKGLAFLHRNSCLGYLKWVKHNAIAALGTRDENGLFGLWWTIGLPGMIADRETWEKESEAEDAEEQVRKFMGPNATDYRNAATKARSYERRSSHAEWEGKDDDYRAASHLAQQVVISETAREFVPDQQTDQKHTAKGDPNNRGRGRTVETQAGGIAVLRALLKLEEMLNDE